MRETPREAIERVAKDMELSEHKLLKQTCKKCEQAFLDLIATQCWIENALECFTNDIETDMCIKCLVRIWNRYMDE